MTTDKLNAIEVLSEWYISHCDGIWEHGGGLSIESIDNPGWSVKLMGEDDRKGADIQYNIESDIDWFDVRASSEEFIANGDSTKLAMLLDMAVAWISGKDIMPN
jgi:hypothetical protein